MLHKYFTEGTEKTKTGSRIGVEVETDFVDENGQPITTQSASRLLAAEQGRPLGISQKLELGRQKIEISVQPQPTANLAIEATLEALDWLYFVARQIGAYPVFGPEIQSSGQLLWVQEERDAIWINLDGAEALEQLCRCSSVQFTVDVHPEEAVAVINRLHIARLHEIDYEPNNRRWLNYLELSCADYRPDRYGGPSQFGSLADYAAQLTQHAVVMHQGRQVKALLNQLENPDIDLFLRSVWWHYRLRRYGESLAVEMRPFARRGDDALPEIWKLVANAAGF